MFPVPGLCYRHFSARSNRIHQEESGRIRTKGIKIIYHGIINCELIVKCGYNTFSN